MPNVSCLMIVKNEAHRFLQSVLVHHLKLLNDILIVDDGSTDDTVDLCKRFTEHVISRPESVPSFLDDEATFRSWAWEQVGRHLELVELDWLLLLDADEFLVPEMGLDQVTADAEDLGVMSVRFAMPEIWTSRVVDRDDEVTDGLQMRVDGFWNKNKNIRLVRYNRHYNFSTGRMGGGSVPGEYGQQQILDTNNKILHFGYMYAQDRIEKYQRYTTSKNVHNSAHIESIMTEPTLQPWDGEVPLWWRGQLA